MSHPMKLHMESEGKYASVFDELQKLEREYPHVIKNQDSLIEDEILVLMTVYAALLFGAQEGEEHIATPRQLRDALYAFGQLRGLRQVIIEHICNWFPATILLTEQVYYQNRFARQAYVRRASCLGPEEFFLYPTARVEHIRNLARAIWRADVLQTTTE
jgi:hypothetical protein